MDPRTFIILAVALACSACAQERPTLYSVQASYLNGPVDPEAGVEATYVAKKTLSDKMLAAIALERVTGRKPDPARLLESY